MSSITSNLEPSEDLPHMDTTPDGFTEDPASSPIRAVLRNRDFRLLWIGEWISVLGDQFYMIALPWLVLQLTGDALAMGMVLALGGIPRALLMLVGGALTDRFSPRRVMLVSNFMRMILVAVLAGMVFTDSVTIGMLYGFALLFGVINAFFYPAQSTIVPRLVPGEHLQTANALVQGTLRISWFAGPMLAGILIALLSGGETTIDGEPVASMQGIGIAFGLDALTFLASALTLWRLSVDDGRKKRQRDEDRSSLMGDIREGLISVWNDVTLRSFFLLIAGANFFINGPIIIGIPMLADTRFPEGAAAYGILMSAYGGGNLLGTVLAMILPSPPARRMGIFLGVIWSGLGFGVLLLGLISQTIVAALVMFIMGLADGYVVILFITWLQKRTPDAMLGRVMSLLSFASVGLMPVSNLLSGLLINWNATATFVIGGGMMALLVFLSMLNPAVHSMELEEGAMSSP
jgi:MFS family permease